MLWPVCIAHKYIFSFFIFSKLCIKQGVLSCTSAVLKNGPQLVISQYRTCLLSIHKIVISVNKFDYNVVSNSYILH